MALFEIEGDGLLKKKRREGEKEIFFSFASVINENNCN